MDVISIDWRLDFLAWDNNWKLVGLALERCVLEFVGADVARGVNLLFEVGNGFNQGIMIVLDLNGRIL